jgi:hypothetical protein
VLTEAQLAVVQALVRDTAATYGVINEADFTSYLVQQGEQALQLGLVETFDQFRQRLVDDSQQRMHDESLDVSWPRP